MVHTVRADTHNPVFAKMLPEQFGGPNGELAAAMRYFTQGWNEPDRPRRSMLARHRHRGAVAPGDGGANAAFVVEGFPAELVDQVEGNYLADLLTGQMPDYMSMTLNSGQNLIGGGGQGLTDSMGAPWTAATPSAGWRPTCAPTLPPRPRPR